MARSPLVDAAGLRAAQLAGAVVTLLDVRWSLTGPPGRQAYEAGHLPGAAFLDLEADLAGPPGRRGRHPLADPADLAAAMRRAGVRRDRPVVAYDQCDGTAAARAWWLLRDMGHPEVRLLDGGYDAWLQAGLPVEAGAGGVIEPGDVLAASGWMPRLSADEAVALARTGVLLDAREPERYRGEVEPVDPVAGHVPGAVSAPTSANLRTGGQMRPTDELTARFADLGVHRGRAVEVGVYCGSGVTAAHEVLALELAGIRAALWPGSWSEWVAEPERTDRPVATGPVRG